MFAHSPGTSRVRRVAYVLKVYPRYSETFIVSEVLGHERAGLDVRIFSLRSSSDTHFQDVISRVRSPVTYIPSHTPDSEVLWSTLASAGEVLPNFWDKIAAFAGEPVKDVYQAILLARLLVSNGITHVHAHFATVATTVARMAAAFADLPYTFTAHAKDLFHESVDQSDLRRKLEDAEAVVTVSDYNVAFLRDRYGAAAKKVRRIYNGLDLEQFPFKRPTAQNSNILAVGRLVEKKGFGSLITACRQLTDRGQSVRCSIVGEGPLELQLREQISGLQLDDVVELLGPLPQKEVIARMRSARVFAAPSVDAADGNREGLPTVLIEAMALGTPCVANDVTGVSEIVIPEDTGLLTVPHDATGLAAALERVLRDDQLCVRLAGNARKLVEQSFDVHRNTAVQRALFAANPLIEEEAA